MSSCLDRSRRPVANRFTGASRFARALVTSLALLAPALAGTGCTQQPASAPPEKPMIVDAAMQRRDWERSAAWYPNGDTLAGVQRYPLRSGGGNLGDPDYANAFYDLLASAGQTIALPFTYLVVPPFAPQVFTGENIPPSHTAMPDFSPPTQQTAALATPTAPEEHLRQLESPEPLPRPAPEREQRRGPLGPGDSEFMSSPPTAEEPD
jgi:hypothetical protein